MLTLLYIGVIFALAVSLITVHAFTSAKDGFEDEFGFHGVSPASIPEVIGLTEKAAAASPDDAYRALAGIR